MLRPLPLPGNTPGPLTSQPQLTPQPRQAPIGAPINGMQQASNRPTAEYLQFLTRKLGRCGDIHPLTGHVCVTQPHDDDVEHMAVQIGGPRDGHVYASWGGQGHTPKPNTDTGINPRKKPQGQR